MFRNLKNRLATEVNKANQTLFSTIISSDSTSLSKDSDIRTSSISSRDENLENNRSRLDSASSDISQTTNYVSPSRQFMPPSDIELEYGGDEDDHETNSKLKKLLIIYKNKFTALKSAYDEVEHEKDNIKDVLQKYQDAAIKRKTELREQIKLYQQEIKLRDNKIEEFTQKLTIQQDLVQAGEEEVRNLHEKNTKLETLLALYDQTQKTYQEKEADLTKERDELLQQLNEKQTFIESMMKDRHPENPSHEVQEHFDSDISVLLLDKERLKEQLESTHLCVQQLETDLELAKQQQQLDEEIKHERDEFKQKYEDLLNLEILNKEFQETILKDKQQIEILKQNLLTENEQHRKAFDTLKTEYENLTNELYQTKQTKDNIQSLLDQITQELTMYKDKYEHTDDQIDQSEAALTKLQHDHDESLAILKSQQQSEFDHKLKELQEENDRIKSEIEILKTESENTRSVLEDELKTAAKQAQDKMTELSLQINERQEEINRLQQLLDEQKNTSNQYEEELKEKSFQIQQLEKELEKSNSLQNELDEKQNQITQLNTTIDELNASTKEYEQFRQMIETSQSNDRQLLEQKDKMIDTLKQDYQLQIEKLNKEHQIQQEEIDNLHQQLIIQLKEKDQQQNERYSQLEIKFNKILSEKSEFEHELDSIRLQVQTTESILNEKTNDHNLKLEQTIKEFEIERDSYRNEIETLKSEIISLININEENTRRIDEFDNEKFNFEQEIKEKDRQITERDEKIQEIELTLEQTKEGGVKLRKALQKIQESITNNEQTDAQDAEIRLRKITDEHEQRLKEQEIEYNTKLKAMAKEMSAQIDEKEQNYNQQLHDFIQKSYKTENDLINNSERKIIDAEHRASIAEQQISKMEEEKKENQLDHYRIVQDLQNQIQILTKEKPVTTEHFSQTTIEDLNHLNDGHHSLVFEPTEVDYLKQIVLAYMTGTDRITMAKVICAVLRYTDNEKSLIIEEEKLRQSRWLNSTR